MAVRVRQAMMRCTAEGDRRTLTMLGGPAWTGGTGAVPSGHPPSTGARRAGFRSRECSGRFSFQAAAGQSQPEAARAENGVVMTGRRGEKHGLFIYLVERSRFTLVGFSAFSLSRRLRSLECAIGRAPRRKGAERLCSSKPALSRTIWVARRI